jgi:hypothetical protein
MQTAKVTIHARAHARVRTDHALAIQAAGSALIKACKAAGVELGQVVVNVEDVRDDITLDADK